VLAVAGEPGLTRDKLIGLFWPEVDAERARHSLTQALYSARRALGADDLLKVGPEIRLNGDRIASDVGDFESALRSGDLLRAVELYQGPFLDGFFVSDSPEFERWCSAQREQFQTKVAGALEELASVSERANDYRAAVEWRRRLAALFPLDAGSAVNLMTVLARSGDRAGALQYAQLHATLLREELDLEPDRVVEALAAKLRQPVEWTPNDSRLPAAGSAGNTDPNGELESSPAAATAREDIAVLESEPEDPHGSSRAIRSERRGACCPARHETTRRGLRR